MTLSIRWTVQHKYPVSKLIPDKSGYITYVVESVSEYKRIKNILHAKWSDNNLIWTLENIIPDGPIWELRIRCIIIIIIINLFGNEGLVKNLQYNTDVDLQKMFI